MLFFVSAMGVLVVLRCVGKGGNGVLSDVFICWAGCDTPSCDCVHRRIIRDMRAARQGGEAIVCSGGYSFTVNYAHLLSYCLRGDKGVF